MAKGKAQIGPCACRVGSMTSLTMLTSHVGSGDDVASPTLVLVAERDRDEVVKDIVLILRDDLKRYLDKMIEVGDLVVSWLL